MICNSSSIIFLVPSPLTATTISINCFYLILTKKSVNQISYIISIIKCKNTINSEIAEETSDDLILNGIKSIHCNKKRLDSSSIFNYVNKELGNFDITHTLIEISLSKLTDDEKLETKYPLGKVSY